MSFDEKFAREHWKMTTAMVVSCAVVVIAAIYVFLWRVANAQAVGLVPTVLGEWTVGYCITFILHAIFWEIVLVGSWTILITIAIYPWYRKLVKKGRKKRPRRKRDNGDAFSFFIWLIWLAVVWTAGKWNLAFQSWTFNDWIYTWLYALLWGFLIVGIPGLMYLVWWISGGKKKKR